MPLFRFTCHECGHRFPELVRFGRDDEVTCPRCGNSALDREEMRFGSEDTVHAFRSVSRWLKRTGCCPREVQPGTEEERTVKNRRMWKSPPIVAGCTPR